jgi:hypothetical protein
VVLCRTVRRDTGFRIDPVADREVVMTTRRYAVDYLNRGVDTLYLSHRDVVADLTNPSKVAALAVGQCCHIGGWVWIRRIR